MPWGQALSMVNEPLSKTPLAESHMRPLVEAASRLASGVVPLLSNDQPGDPGGSCLASGEKPITLWKLHPLGGMNPSPEEPRVGKTVDCGKVER